MQRLGLGGSSIVQSSTRPSRVIFIPQAPVPTLPPPPTRTFISALTANTVQVTSPTHPEYAGTFVVGQAPESGVPYYFIRQSDEDIYFWFPGGTWVLDSISLNEYVANTMPGGGLNISSDLPTDGWRTMTDVPIDFTFTVIN